MNVLCKPGVWFGAFNDHTIEFLTALDEEGERWGDIPMITSAGDGKHMKGSKHYVNEAWDVRVWNLRNPAGFADGLRERLNKDGEKYLILFGDQYHRDHIHGQTIG